MAYFYNHMLMPIWYDDPEEEFWRLISHVTLCDVAGERQVEISGADSARFVRFLTPRNLSKCAPGRCHHVLLTADDGNRIDKTGAAIRQSGRSRIALALGGGQRWAVRQFSATFRGACSGASGARPRI